ncbi:MAG: YdcF family protein [Acidobacteriota bacterium]
MAWIIWLKKLVLPPGGPLLLAFVCAVLLANGAAEWAAAGLLVALAGLYLAASPFFGCALLRSLERYAPVDVDTLAGCDAGRTAIVVLDAGRVPDAREYGADSVKPQTLERLRYAAWLHRRSGLPILASGDGAGPLMAEVLADSFRVDTRWVESTSRNTQENADRAAALLRRDGFEHALVVSHHWHLPRAMCAFERTGLRVTPAPMGFSVLERWERRGLAIVPSVRGLELGYVAIHELIGRAWYRLRYGRG